MTDPIYYSEENYFSSGSLYERLGIGTRSAEATGRDLVIEPMNDLVTNGMGDLKTHEGTALIKQALLRRLGTPEYGYRRWIRTAQGLKEINTDYGNKVYLYLSAPATPTTVEQIRTAIIECMQADKRIEVLTVQVETTREIGRIPLAATYRIKGEPELQSLDYVLAVN